jgi:hypothetical protein
VPPGGRASWVGSGTPLGCSGGPLRRGGGGGALSGGADCFDGSVGNTPGGGGRGAHEPESPRSNHDVVVEAPASRPAGPPGGAGGRGAAGGSEVPSADLTPLCPASGAGARSAGGSGRRASAAASNGWVSSAGASPDAGRSTPLESIRSGGRCSPMASSSPQPRKAPQAGLRQNGSDPGFRNPHDGQTLIRRAPPSGWSRPSSRRSLRHQSWAPVCPARQTSRPSIPHPLSGCSGQSQPDRTSHRLLRDSRGTSRGPFPCGLPSILDGGGYLRLTRARRNPGPGLWIMSGSLSSRLGRLVSALGERAPIPFPSARLLY